MPLKQPGLRRLAQPSVAPSKALQSRISPLPGSGDRCSGANFHACTAYKCVQFVVVCHQHCTSMLLHCDPSQRKVLGVRGVEHN